MDDATSWQTAPPAFPRADIPEVGVISLATLDELREAHRAERANANHLNWQADELDELAEDRLADAGALLVPRRAWWRVPARLVPRMLAAELLVRLVALLDRWTARVPPEAQWLARAGRRIRAAAAAGLRRDLVAIAGAAAADGPGVPDVGPLLAEAAELRARAGGLHGWAASIVSRMEAVAQEIRLREEAVRHMGFDSLHVAADFRVHSMPAVACPFELPPGEVAHLVTGATLAELPPGGVRGAGGAAVPVAHTGLRHWIGSFRNRPAPVAALDPADSGTLVVSSLRLLFASGRESVVIWLDGVLDMYVYDDGIAVSSLGREAPHLLLLAAPKPAAFCINWAISAAVGGGFDHRPGDPTGA